MPDSDVRPLKNFAVAATEDGSGVVFGMKTNKNEVFTFLTPANRLSELFMSFLRLAVHPLISAHAKPLPKWNAGGIQKTRVLPLAAIGAFVVPGTEKVGFDLELPGSIRLVFQIGQSEAIAFSKHLQTVVLAGKEPSSSRHH